MWNAGTQQGTGPGERTIITGGLEMTSGTRVLSGRTLVLESDTQWTGGNWQIRGGATIVNRPGAVLSFANTWLDDTDPKTTDTLINEGTLAQEQRRGHRDVRAGGGESRKPSRSKWESCTCPTHSYRSPAASRWQVETSTATFCSTSVGAR